MTGNSDDWPTWPASIEQPPLPAGYEWVCLCPAFGLRNFSGEHPWWIRLCWTTKNGKKRMLKLSKHYFPSAEGAIAFAGNDRVKGAHPRAR